MLTVDRLYTIIISNLINKENWVLFQEMSYGGNFSVRHLRARIVIKDDYNTVFLARRRNYTAAWNYYFLIKKYETKPIRNRF